MVELSQNFLIFFAISIVAGAILFFLFQPIDLVLEKIERILVVLILLSTIGLALTQVILRNFFNTGIPWGDPFVRFLVLWLGLIGASLATKEGSHLAMDLASRFLPLKLRKPTAIFVDGTSAFVCALLALAGYKFVLAEKMDGKILDPGIPTYIANLIIPIAFYLMSLRFSSKILKDIKVLLKGEA